MRPIAVLDIETDPFRINRIPEPFCIEFYSDTETFVAWGDDCIEEFIVWLSSVKTKYDIYAHNGGRFDFIYLAEFLNESRLKIINGRLVKASIGHHNVIDSWSILPFPLKSLEKKMSRNKKWTEFRYAKLDRRLREKYKSEILEYLHHDCTYLYDLVYRFRETFGNKLTVGGASVAELKKHVSFQKLTKVQDKDLRKYYYGGRVECFDKGLIDGDFKCYDENSAYPFAMKTYNHPLGNEFISQDTFPSDRSIPWMATVIATNDHAFISRDDDGRVTFAREQGEFDICSHEYWTAMDHGMIKIKDILSVKVPKIYGNFEAFVDHFYNLRLAAKANGDAILELFWKFILNSSYGKFGTNPEKFMDYIFDRHAITWHEALEGGYDLINDNEEYRIWGKPSQAIDGYLNVATAASITSAARAMLMDGLNLAIDPVYCDTDSIICQGFRGKVDGSTLGSWKHEASSDHMAIGGKKMYLMYNGTRRKPEKVKMASKGVKFKPSEIIRVAMGETVRFASVVPKYGMLNPVTSLSSPKYIRPTATNIVAFRGIGR